MVAIIKGLVLGVFLVILVFVFQVLKRNKQKITSDDSEFYLKRAKILIVLSFVEIAASFALLFIK